MAFKNIKKWLTADGEDPDMTGDEDNYYNTDKNALKEAEKSGNNMILLEPRAYSESTQIADHLKNRNSVVVNLKRVTSDQAKRIIDFLSGVSYAIGGSMQKIGIGIYLCTPKNVAVQGKITDEAEKRNNKNDTDEELDW